MIHINQACNTNVCKRSLVFDKDLFKKEKIIKYILEYSSSIENNSSAEEAVESFNNSWQQKLRKLKIIREKVVSDKEPQFSKKIKKLILNKRQISKNVGKGIIPHSEFDLIKKALKKAIRKVKRRKYINFIKKGIEYLKNHDHRNSWKWVKRHCGVNKRSTINSLVIDPDSGHLIDDPIKKMIIWFNHFKNLSNIDPNERIYEVDYKPNINYLEITDSIITWGR